MEYGGPSLRPYEPSFWDRLAQWAMGDGRASPERRRMVEGVLGTSGLGNTDDLSFRTLAVPETAADVAMYAAGPAGRLAGRGAQKALAAIGGTLLGYEAEDAEAGILGGARKGSRNIVQRVTDAAKKPSSDDLTKTLSEKYPGVDFYVTDRAGKPLVVNKIVVPEEMRGQGVGTAFMRDVMDYADQSGRSVALTPSADFGGNKKQLEDWYLSMGFQPNKGRSRDLEISESMYRLPQKPENPLSSRTANLYNPPPKPQRPFVEDYPDGTPPSDATGQLARTIDGDDLRARFIVGRTMAGGADEALSPAEFDALTEAITGRGVTVVPPSAFRRPGTVGEVVVNKYSRQPELVQLSDKLSPSELQKVYAAEIGHVIDQASGEIPVAGVKRQAEKVYNTLNTGRERDRALMGPQHVGYSGEDVPRELMAEAIRAYITDPNYIKTVAPELAKRIRENVNRDAVLSKIIQFNSVSGLLGAGAAASQGGILAPFGEH